MQQRPELNKNLDPSVFLNFYYLKDELIAFCRENGLPASGGKQELTQSIARFLETGEIQNRARTVKKAPVVGALTPDTLIEQNIVCSEKHRAFFREQLGKGFSFNVAFQGWLKENAGKTYAQAVEAYRAIAEEKKNTTAVIGSQFEYNTYIRAFFAANPQLSLRQAIICWKFKKSLPGHNRYEESDLSALN